MEQKQAEQLAKEHWEYTKTILEAVDFDKELIVLVGTIYILSMIHGYKHGYEDARKTS